MKISSVNSGVSFSRDIKIIDAHMHDKPTAKLGQSAVANDVLKFLSPFSTATDTFIPQKIFPSAIDCCFYDKGKPHADEIVGNEQIIKTFEGTKIDNFLAVCQPKDGKVENIKQLFEKYKGKFIGLKFHPNCSELPADSKLYDPYLKFAEEKGIPCLFHSDRTFDKTYIGGDGKLYPELKSEFSRPEQIYTLAKRHPNVPIVMAHFGGPEKEDINATLEVMLSSINNGDAKLYADISWLGIDDYTHGTRDMNKLVTIIKKLKDTPKGDMTDRILFGTDAPIGRFSSGNEKEIYKDYICDIHSAINKNFPNEAEELTDKIFYKNAKNLFFPEKQNIVTGGKNFAKKLPIIAFAVAAVVGLSCLGVKLYKNNKQQSQKQPQEAKTSYIC